MGRWGSFLAMARLRLWVKTFLQVVKVFGMVCWIRDMWISLPSDFDVILSLHSMLQVGFPAMLERDFSWKHTYKYDSCGSSPKIPPEWLHYTSARRNRKPENPDWSCTSAVDHSPEIQWGVVEPCLEIIISEEHLVQKKVGLLCRGRISTWRDQAHIAGTPRRS